ncbi:Isopentenyl-diphosphate Delta-isomerase [Streptococcus parauberis]|uniref:Nudix hydrolase n=1 Tax=Streptococcus parauberis KRS-02083 TaxID=1207545 RepID=A0ABN0ISZ1_9STRE|nr:NUDIX domain-containing protein [Streptococcus parauberis]AUT06107.1 Isopentenyl-diphosphate Delta-isomerase [Streptococcus parauberis]EMG25885.1 Putative Nudix hydrolase [Streptococcus parauberis KRS-02083]MDT2749468.1 NUDIX domain-containing protein [Streptococcus parauberis]PIO78877.1 Isopentenyl-diphosphate Delta-isomerase [Streptococcus parauberis]POS68086.1 Isopentenyl-diphosphate Delta-isomerase [Streptococcus parauberis]
MAEIWDIYDIYRNKTGRTMERGSNFKEGDLHLVVHLCIFNTNGELLIQQRQKDKEGFPNMWDISVGGSALAGETPQQAVMRETLEELGICIDLSQIRPQFTINFDQGFDDTFLVIADVDLNSLTLQEEEVQDAKWASRKEIFKMMTEGSFIPYHLGKIQLCFDMLGQYGAHVNGIGAYTPEMLELPKDRTNP